MDKTDFTKGSVVQNILGLAVPITLAQLINVLYNVVDRIYIGRMPENATLSMTGLGLSLPLISIIIAFANLVGMGGAPLCAIARGKGDDDEAEKIMGNSFILLIIFGVLLTFLILVLKRPLLFAFGASDATFPFADEYLTIYVSGSIFVMCGLGLNNFINSQGFGKIGMMTVLIGALCNIALDPLFIFVFNLGVQGAAWATIISQCASAVWILLFLTGKKSILKLRFRNMSLKIKRVKEILMLGMAGFTMSLTNSTVQIVCNATLKLYGGDVYVGVMTIINSLREVVFMPMQGLSQAAQPVMGYNYGAKEYGRVRRAIRILAMLVILYTTLAWLILLIFPAFFIRMFNQDVTIFETTVPAMQIYFFGIFLMALQHTGQSVFVALGKSKQAIFFSLFRKVIIVTPLTLLLPKIANLGTTGVFLAEPISNLLGGGACFLTMMFTIWPELKHMEKQQINEKMYRQ
jgi:putative MATE family efflux protein